MELKEKEKGKSKEKRRKKKMQDCLADQSENSVN